MKKAELLARIVTLEEQVRALQASLKLVSGRPAPAPYVPSTWPQYPPTYTLAWPATSPTNWPGKPPDIYSGCNS